MVDEQDWQSMIDANLMQRLWRPTVRPGRIDPRMAQAIVARYSQWTTPFPLLPQLLRRGHSKSVTTPQSPIVYAQMRQQSSESLTSPASPHGSVQSSESSVHPLPLTANPSDRPLHQSVNGIYTPLDRAPIPSPTTPLFPGNPTVIQAKFEPSATPFDNPAIVAPFNGSHPPTVPSPTPLSDLTAKLPLPHPWPAPNASLSVQAGAALEQGSFPQLPWGELPRPPIHLPLITPHEAKSSSQLDRLPSYSQPQSLNWTVLPAPMRSPLIVAALSTPTPQDQPLISVKPYPPRSPSSATQVKPFDHKPEQLPTIQVVGGGTTATPPPHTSLTGDRALPLALPMTKILPGYAAQRQGTASVNQARMPGLVRSEMESTPVRSAVSATTPIVSGQAPSPAAKQSAPAINQPRSTIDVDALADKVERKLMRKLAIERERRGVPS